MQNQLKDTNSTGAYQATVKNNIYLDICLSLLCLANIPTKTGYQSTTISKNISEIISLENT